MKKIILITLCSIFSISVTNAQMSPCKCMDLSITIMTEALEKGEDIVDDLDEIEKKYAKRSEMCEKLYTTMGEEKMMSEMMACPRFNEMMELTMEMMKMVDPEMMEKMMEME